MSSVFIVAAKRTPFGAFGGSLKGLSATELGVVSNKAALAQANNLDPSLVDAVCFGNVIQSSSDAAYLARHVGLKSGLPLEAGLGCHLDRFLEYGNGGVGVHD